MTGRELWEMPLNTEVDLESCRVLRVPGGWVYSNAVGGSCFVPKDNEFLESSNEVANNVINPTGKPQRLRMKLHEATYPPDYVQAYIADEMDEYLGRHDEEIRQECAGCGLFCEIIKL